MIEKKFAKYISSISPVITEKALKNSADSYVVFKAPHSADKSIVKQVIEYLYKDVKVLKMNVAKVKGKVKNFRRTQGKRADYKKFFVKLDKNIDITTGIK